MLIDVADHAHLLPTHLLRHRLLLQSIIIWLLRRHHELLVLARCHVLGGLRLHLRRTLVELALRDFVIELFMPVIWLLLIHHVVMLRLLGCYERRPSLDVARGVVRVSHPHRLLRLVRVELLDWQPLALESLLLLNLLDEVGLILFVLVVLHEVARSVLDHEVL